MTRPLALGRSRHRGSVGVVAAASGVAYSWWATEMKSFSMPSYLVVAAPGLVLVVAYGTAGGLAPGRGEVSEHYRRRAGEWPRLAMAPWFAILAAAVGLEAAGLALGGRSPTLPTLSTAIDRLLVTHLGKAAVFALWLSVGWCWVFDVRTRTGTEEP